MHFISDAPHPQQENYNSVSLQIKQHNIIKFKILVLEWNGSPFGSITRKKLYSV